MNSIWKRSLAMLLSLVMVFGMVPVNAFADDGAEPNADVTLMESLTLSAGEYNVWNGSLTEGTEDRDLQIVMNFKANDTLEDAQAGGYGDWLCDFYLTFEGLKEGKIVADNSYLAGNYGTYGWIVVPTDGMELENKVEYPVVSSALSALTYEDICKDVKEFTAALYIDPAILAENPDFQVTLKLKMEDPENPENVLTVGEPAVFTAEDLLGEEEPSEPPVPVLPNADVTLMESLTLSAGEYNVWNGSLTEGAEDRDLQIVMNFKANDTLEDAQAGGYGDWLCDFYLTFEGLKDGKIVADNSYLAGNYGTYGWIVVPTDGMELENKVEYPVVSSALSALTYEDICKDVKEFTAALYIDPAILAENPDFQVTLELKMEDPENPENVLTVGDPAIFTAEDLLGEEEGGESSDLPVDEDGYLLIDLNKGSYSIEKAISYPGYRVLPYEGENTLTVDVGAGQMVRILMDDVNITAKKEGESAVSVLSGTARMVSAGSNKLIGGKGGAGIYVADVATAVLQGSSIDCSFTAIGNGGVDTADCGAAGIGGTWENGDSGSITIQQVTVNAYGYGKHGSGIGSCSGETAGPILIGGYMPEQAGGAALYANVNAYGGFYANGAGTKLQTKYGKSDPEGGAGIGGGGSAANITIANGTVKAYGGSKAAGIGAKFWKDAGTITITGDSDVTVQGGSSSAGIGTSRAGDGVSSNIVISGGKVNATGGDYGAGIGAGYNADSVGNGTETAGLPETKITISGGKVTATGGMGGAAIGGGYKSDNVNIDITGSETEIIATVGACVEGKSNAEGLACAIGSGANGSGIFENSPAVEIASEVKSVTVNTDYQGKPAIEGMTNAEAKALANVTVVDNAPGDEPEVTPNLPNAEVKVLEAMTLTPDEHGHDIWDGKNLAVDTEDRPLQAVMNFKAKETLEEAKLGGYGKYKCDFYLTFDNMTGDSISGNGSYLAGNYGSYGWIVVPTDSVTIEEGVEYPVVSAYDPNVTYEQVCDSVKDFTAALYVSPETLKANPDMTVTLQLKMTNPDDEKDVLTIGDAAVYTADDLMAASGYVAQNTKTGKFFTTVSAAVAEAQAGETVILLADSAEQMLAMLNGVTLDLNGHALEVIFATAFNGNYIIDSTEGAGLLKVPNGKLALQENNPYLAIWNGSDGYVFARCTTFNQMAVKQSANKVKFYFETKFDPNVHGALKAGKAVSGVELLVDLFWMSESTGKLTSKQFTYSDELVQGFFNSYNPETGKYGATFTLTLTGVPEGLDLSIGVIYKSKTGVEYTLPTVEDTPEDNTSGDGTNTVTEEVTLKSQSNNASAVVPTGTQLEANASDLNLQVQQMTKTSPNITIEDGESALSLDVHVEGISENNTVPVLVTLPEITDQSLNQGNIRLYHVENGEAVLMTQVASLEALTKHNQFHYDASTRTVTLALATFSEVAVVADTTNAWNGGFDYSWYTNAVAVADGETVTEYIISNADQLAGFGAIVGGMNGQTQDSFAGKTVKLTADIDLNDLEGDKKIFYPIGYNSSDGKYEKTGVAVTTGFYTFNGTFDGNGHTISNFYQNTWEMKGDHDWYSPEEQYYRDGMGLFGKVYGGTVKNLTVKNFSSDGEIATTGVIAAYADGATFENISIFDCNPRVYNIGNGGIVGCVGWYAKEADLKTTFTNITVDNSNKISALWGSWDVACGGIVGQYYPTSGQSSANYPVNAGVHFENCHVSAIMDVYNDVCANYQYYAYRYTGMLIGSIRENMPADANGHVYPKMDGITAKDCTVNFGDWNDYYYCELVANTKASYTHDHQMSRLTQVASVDVVNKKVVDLKGEEVDIPNGRVNYVVVAAKDAEGKWIHGDGANFATCYHFVDGVQHKHDEKDKDNPEIYEIVNGEQVLKEDKQLIYREFNQLFTGYGWGVTSKGVTDFENVTTMGVSTSTQQASVEKFAAKNGYQVLKTEKEYKIGELFAENTVETAKVAINDATVMVAVTDNNTEDGSVTAIFEQNKDDWKKSTLKLTGNGEVTIAIQDYNLCKITTLKISVGAEEVSTYTDRFEIAFDHDEETAGKQNYVKTYLYRVGNANNVAVGKLFSAIAGQEDKIGNVTVTVAAVDGDVVGNYVANNSDWTQGTIDFNGTGSVKLVIEDDNFSKKEELNLEVIEGYNVTGNMSGWKSDANNVLLENVKLSNGTLSLSNKKLFGNGFELDITLGANDADTNTNFSIIGLRNAKIDNTRIVGEAYKSYGVMANSAYSAAAVGASGKSEITNSYIANCLSPVKALSGTLSIQNTTLEGGRYCNLDVRGASVELDGVTTINTSFGGKIAPATLGLGIVIYHENSDNARITIADGGLTQYNWLYIDGANPETGDYQYFKGDSTMQAMYKAVFKNANGLNEFVFSNNGKTYVNTGILSLNPNVGDGAVINVPTGYTGYDVSYVRDDGYLWTSAEFDSEKATGSAGTYTPDIQGAYDPVEDWNHPEGEYVVEGDKITISFDEGSSYVFNPHVLTATKMGQNLPVTVSSGSKTFEADETIEFTETGTHTFTYTYTDPYVYGVDGTVTGNRNYEVVVTVEVHAIHVSVPAPTFTFVTKTDSNAGDRKGTYSGQAGKAGEVHGQIKTVEKNGQLWIMPDVDGADRSGFGSGTPNTNGAIAVVDGIYFPILSGEIEITKGSTISKGTIKRHYPFYGTGKETAGSVTIEDNNVTYNYDNPSSALQFYSEYDGTLGVGVGSADDFGLAQGQTSSGAKCTECKWGITSGAISGGEVKNDKYGNNVDSVWYAKFSYTAANEQTYYYYLGFAFKQNKDAAQQEGCVTGDTLITLANGTQKRIDEVMFADQILAWDFFAGEYVAKDIALLVNHGEDLYQVINLEFSDGTKLRLIEEHGVFDYDLNKYVYINMENMQDYIGHQFVQQNLDGEYNIVTLDKAYMTEEVTSAWSITSAGTSNAFASGMLTVAPPEDFYNWIEMDGKLHYDVEQFQKDVEEYGLYTYDVFADYVTYDQFMDWNGAYLKIPVEKGLFTFEYILDLIELYKEYMP